MGTSGDERRGAPRTPIELKVTYKKLNTFFHDYTRNISKGGTFIRTEKPLTEGTEFIFKLLVPELMDPLSLTGKVKWVITPEDLEDDEKDLPEDAPGMGIQFLYSSDEERLRVESTVERLMKKHLGERTYMKLMEKA